MVGELKDGQIREYEIHPEDFGLTMMSSRNLKVADAAESKAMLLGVLDNQPGAAREIVALNAGTALYTANVADSIGAGIAGPRSPGLRRGPRQDGSLRRLHQEVRLTRLETACPTSSTRSSP
jgi:hypothetical protein